MISWCTSSVPNDISSRLLYCHSRWFQTCHWRTQMLPGALKVFSGAQKCSQTSHNCSHGTPVPVTLKAGRNALLGSDTLLKLMHLSLHSTFSQRLLVASSDKNSFCWCLQTPEPPGCVILCLTSQWIRYIYQCQLYVSISEGVRVGGTITISRIKSNLAVVAATAACQTVEWIPVLLCSSQSQGSSGSQGNQEWAPKSRVQYCPNTGFLMSTPLPSLATSVQYKFHGKGSVDCSQK